MQRIPCPQPKRQRGGFLCLGLWECATTARNANLFDTVADDRHRLEIVGLVASLNFVELIASIMPRALWKVEQAFERIAKEAHWPHSPSISNWI
jgi:hypothetical protein